MSAVLQSNARLAGIERDFLLLYIRFSGFFVFVDKAIHHLVADNGGVDDLLAVLHLYFYIEPAHRLDADQRPHLAEAVTAAFFHADRIVRLFLKLKGADKPALLDNLL